MLFFSSRFQRGAPSQQAFFPSEDMDFSLGDRPVSAERRGWAQGGAARCDVPFPLERAQNAGVRRTARRRSRTTPVFLMPQEPHVFVYGTLRRGEINDINRLRPAPRLAGEARIRGALYDLGAYPGVILGGQAWVQGEVYAVTPELERQLDVIEGVAPVPSGEYTRRHLDVEVAGRMLRCLVYEITAARVQGRPRIVSGNWLRRS